MAGDNEPEKHGLFRLHPHGYNPSDCDVDIVAFHGLSGDAFKTWTDKDGHLWLRDSLPEHIPNARIMTFGYDSALKNSTSRMTVFDFAQDLLTRLVMERQDPLERERPIIFLCHSLGGIVAKQALILAHIRHKFYGTIVKSTTGIAFFGTPHRGSKIASTGRILSRIVNAASLSRTIRSDLLKTLEISSQSLDQISQLSSQILSGISIISFYEQKPLGSTGSLIVEQFSAILGFPNERAIPINSDHRGISRCSPRHPNRYLPVWSSLKEMVEKSLLESRREYDEFMDRLFCVDYKTAQLRPRQPHRGTCDWIFRNPTFRAWINSRQSAVLLLSAPPGFGKTVLTRHVMEQVLAGEQMYSDGTCINLGVSFFCSYNDQISTSEQTVLRSLLHQLLQLHPRAQRVVCNGLLERNLFSLTYNFTPDKLWVAIREVLSMNDMANTFVCIDAIEELNAEDCRRIVAGFNDIVKDLNKGSNSKHRIRVFFSSRPSAQYGVNYPSMRILSMNRQHTEADIRNYLSDSIAEFCRTNAAFAAAMANRGSTSIVEKMTKRAGGMFLWATVAWEHFCHGLFWNEDVLEQRLLDLESTPPGINPLYNKLLDNIDPSHRKDMWAFFAMLAVAKRPLDEAELSELLPVMVSYRDELTSPCEVRPFPNLLDIVEKHCRDLITVHDDGTILFSHLSFKEYLLQTWATDRPEILEKAKVSITKACLAYIKYWDSLATDTQDENQGSTPQLSGYAVYHHLSHLASLSSDHPLWITYAEMADSSYFASDKHYVRN
ncbi:ankyrin repeats (3 copies) domain-containing [Fusarium albosuccineum]|uniref:Ankyrin repeats (3 copies) domain-containing n=1 Tax=Fusarium albosuccineum TaxID=1237068 RepID=A0A8H4LA50_9HYPO|nr:ankyrin repeats (3 copies) domain-containing [Fusarium albosuccineum]